MGRQVDDGDTNWARQGLFRERSKSRRSGSLISMVRPGTHRRPGRSGDSFDGEDSRKSIFTSQCAWPRCELSQKEERTIKGFMDETGYRFGRFDFIRKNGELWFLELNPNGQWAWLDEKNEHGLVSMVADAIKREDAAHRARPSLHGLPSPSLAI